MRSLTLPFLLALLATSGCHGTDPESLPSPETVCAGVYCTAGRCGSDRGTPVCVCGPTEQQLGLTCEVDETGDFDQDSAQHAQPLGVPTLSAQGRLHLRDLDAFTFEAVKGRVYRFTCTPEGFGECEVRVGTNPFSSNSLAPSLREGRDTVVTFRASASGPHVVQLGAWPLYNADVRGTYRYSLVEVHDAEGDDTSAAQVTTDGRPFTGRSDYPDDEDSFAFDAVAGSLYRLSCTSDAPSMGASLVIASDGLSVSVYFETPPGGVTGTVRPKVDGRYLLRVRASAVTQYECSVTTLPPDDHGDTVATGTPVSTFPAQLVGTLEVRDDVDVFTFTALAGHSYDLLCEPANDRLCGVSYIAHPNRTIPPRPITVASDQPLQVIVFGDNQYSTGPGRTGAYRLTLRDLGPDQGSSARDAVPLQPDTTVEGLLSPDSEEDWFHFETEPGRVYRVALASGSAFLGVFRATAPSYNLLRYTAASSGWVKTDVAETLFIRVHSFGSGPYRLVLESAGSDDHADTREDATPLPGPALRVVGRLDAAEDVDWFAMDLQARGYALTASSASFLLVEGDGVTRVPYDNLRGTYQPRAAGRHFLRVYTSDIYFNTQPHYLFELIAR